jgi:hypothetical protein
MSASGRSEILAPEASGSVSPSPAQPAFRRPGKPVEPADHHASRDQRDSADKIEPALAAEPIEKMEATEATEPIERTDPAEPMHRIEPAEPMDKMDPLDPMLRSEPAEPADCGDLSVFAILGFSHPLPITGTTGHPARYPLRICSLRMSACPQCWASSRSTWRYTQRNGSGPRQ